MMCVIEMHIILSLQMSIKYCLCIFVSPLLFIIIINQSFRSKYSSKEHFYLVKSNYLTASSTSKCTWKCHHDTQFCKKHHVKFSYSLFPYIDYIYFGIINVLAYSNDYRVANVIILGFLFPLFIYLLLIKSLVLKSKIKKYTS